MKRSANRQRPTTRSDVRMCAECAPARPETEIPTHFYLVVTTLCGCVCVSAAHLTRYGAYTHGSITHSLGTSAGSRSSTRGYAPSRHDRRLVQRVSRPTIRLRHCCPYGTYDIMYHVSATNCTTTKPKEMICHLSQKTETRVPARGHGKEGEVSSADQWAKERAVRHEGNKREANARPARGGAHR